MLTPYRIYFTPVRNKECDFCATLGARDVTMYIVTAFRPISFRRYFET